MVDVKPAPVLTSEELFAFAPVYEIACAESAKTFTIVKSTKFSPLEMTTLRQATEKCFTRSYNGMMESCKDPYDALYECMRQNKTNYSKCSELRDSLAQCAAANKLGEMVALKK